VCAGDEAVSLGVRVVLVSVGVVGVLWLAGRLGRRWWLAGGPALAAAGVVVALLQPVAVEPLTNRFEPLPDRALAADVRELARREGVRVDQVEVADASRRTTAENAYVTGLGPTKHVVFYDTALDGSLGRPELRSLAAHELGHVAAHHLWKGVAWFALLAIPGVGILALVLRRAGDAADPTLVPLGLLVALVLVVVTLPLTNAVSRRYEAEADWKALTSTGDPRAAIGLDRRLALSGLVDPGPPTWATVWLATHPAVIHRIGMACAFAERSGAPAPPGCGPVTRAARGGS
jgi:STE24 endopeptidase